MRAPTARRCDPRSRRTTSARSLTPWHTATASGCRRTIELQVLRGLGDDAAAAIAATGRRVRVYCPVGDLVAGMAYLVRRLLENTSNDSFLAAQTTGAELDLLLEKP